MASVRKGGTAKKRTRRRRAPLDVNAIVEASLDAIIGHELDGTITYWNGGAARMFGYAAAEMIGQPISRIIPPDRIDEGERILARVAKGEPLPPIETQRMARDGRVIDVSVTAAPIYADDGSVVGSSKVIRDITVQIAQTHALERLTRLYAALSQVNQAIVWSPGRGELLQRICRVLGEHGGFRMIWVGWHDPETQRLAPVAIWGDEGGYVERIRVFVDDRPEGRGPSGTAFREGYPVVINDSLNDPSTRPWRDEVIRRGFRSSAAFPIRMQGRVCAVLSVYADERDFFQEREIELLTEAATDISFALDNIAKDEERLAAEAAVRSEREFSERMIDSTPGAMYFYDAQGRFLRWNRGLEQASGYTHDEVARMHPLDFIAPADRPLVQERIAEVFATGESSVEAGLVRKDGRGVPFFFTGRRVDYRGEPCLVGVGIDISIRRDMEEALRESERRFHELAANINEVFWIATAGESQVVYVSPAYEQIWGRSCAELYATSDSWLDSIHQDDRARVRVAAATKQLIGEYDETYRIVRPDGTIRWIRDRAFPVHDESGRVERLVGVARDITETRHLEEQFRHAQKMEAVGRLASGVAHDFNNILAVIQLQAGMLAGQADPASVTADYAREIELAAQRASNLTRQLLLFSRQQAMQPRALDLNEVVTRITKMLQRVLGEHIRMQIRLSAYPLYIHADAGMLDQVLLNLAVNSRDAMPKGGTLTIETSLVEIDQGTAVRSGNARVGSFACLQVEDTGTGIPGADLPRIFEPFFTRKDVGQGTGLGLATVFGIVQQHEGWIDVASEPERGTTFRIFLPSHFSASKPEVAVPEQPFRRGEGEVVLLVEDEAAVRAAARTTLIHLGYSVIEAPNGVDALRTWAAHRDDIDLVLTDLVMPGGMSGTDLARALRRDRPQLPVVFMTGYSAEVADPSGSMEDGVNLLYKPFDADRLARIVRKRLGPSVR